MGRPASKAFLRALRASSRARADSLGPATREPGDPVRAEAIELLACLASQPYLHVDTYSQPMLMINYGLTRSLWSPEANACARKAWDEINADHDIGDWLDAAEHYAEAETRLREEKRHGP